MKVYYQLSRYCEDKGLIQRTRKKLSGSFVKQFMQILYSRITYTNLTVIDSQNNSRNFDATSSPSLACISSGTDNAFPLDLDFGLPSGNSILLIPGDYVGIILGTSDTPVDMDDAGVLLHIDHGTSTGEMEYLSCAGSTVTVSAPSASWTLERYFRNSSGGTITIKELGIYALGRATVPSVVTSFCIIRDVLSPTVSVNNGEYLKVVYTFTITA